MQIEVGRVVRSKAGHDSNDIFAVVGTDENYVFISDGKQRKVEKPKRKNPKHLEVTSYMLLPEEMAANGRLKKALSRLRTEADKSSGGFVNVQAGYDRG